VPLAWWLDFFLQKAKFPVFKTLACADSALTAVGWFGTEKTGSHKNALLDKSRVLNSKCPKHSAKKADKNKRVVLPV
jgi:hypothetical protein